MSRRTKIAFVVSMLLALVAMTVAIVPCKAAALTPTLLAILEAERAATVPKASAGSVAPQAAVVPAMPDLAPPQPKQPPAKPIIVTGPQRAAPLNSAPQGGRWVRVQRCYGDHCRLEWQWSPQ